MADRTIKATVVRDPQRAVTHYELKDGDTSLGVAVKNEKNEFVFTANKGVELDGLRAKTMRDLKSAILSKLPKTAKKPNGQAGSPKEKLEEEIEVPSKEQGLDPTSREDGDELDLS